MPTKTTSPRPFARALAAAATALLLTAGGLIVASPANAHDELASTDPSADSTVDALPEQLTLVFSGELATDPGATELQVTDAAGTSLADGDPVVEGTNVTQTLAGAASGAITVLWKVVSSDGHPISGEFGFTVTAPPTPTPTSTPTASATPIETPTAEPTPTPTETPVPAADENSALPWVIGGLLLAAVGGAVIYLLASRARRIRDEEALRASAAQAAAGGAPDASAPHSEPPADR
jgi:methionine-rich copper-binding protein CopC